MMLINRISRTAAYTCSGALLLPMILGAPARADRTLTHEAVIDAPASTIWHLFTTTEGARQWMAPKIEFNLRIGGEIHSSYHPESNLNDEHTIINRVLAYLPGRMLSIRNTQVPKGFAHPDRFQQTWSVMWFTPVDDNRTNVRLVGLNYGEGPEWDVVYDHFERGNAYLLDLLAKTVATFDGSEETNPEGARDAAGAPPIETEVTVNAPIEQVWRAWTTSEGVGEFFARESNIDLRIGGPYELFFAPDAPEGQRGSEGCRILTYEPQRMLAVSWNAPPQFPNVRDHHTWVVLEFEPRDDEAVTVRLTHLGFDQLQAAHPELATDFHRTRSYFDRVWPHVLDSLKRTLEAR